MEKELTTLSLYSILGIAAGRCVSNGSTAETRPDPFWNFPVIVLLGESENRLGCILGSIPIFWPMVEEAAERVHQMYRVLITQEFIVQSSRVLPGEVTVEVGAYEAPHWAERSDRSVRSVNSSTNDEGKQSRQLNPSDLSLPPWPVTPPDDSDGEPEEAGVDRSRTEGSDENV